MEIFAKIFLITEGVGALIAWLGFARFISLASPMTEDAHMLGTARGIATLLAAIAILSLTLGITL